MLHVIPIEPLKERYSAQWLKWIREYLNNHKKTLEHRGQDFSYQIHNPPKTYKMIGNGSFLDVVGTNLYKNRQMKQILSYLEAGNGDGDVFWFHDMWFPGLEMLAYIRDGLGLNFKIYGMLHAGTYDPHDFLTKKGMLLWGEPQETSWFRIVDGIFVATKFHKDLLIDRRNTFDISKIHITGFPIYDTFSQNGKPWHERENLIVFPHRLDDEKQPELCLELFDILKADPHMRDYRIVLSKKECGTKDEYYELLSRAKFSVSFALQETWGISMMESVICGAVPIVPNRLSYQEMYHSWFLYNETVQDAADVIKNIATTDRPGLIQETLDWNKKQILYNGNEAIKRQMQIMYPR